jgi:two-component system, chemotaxis family, protein-glutamate methylesterase/glutaminase
MIRVLLVDDSAVARRQFAKILGNFPDVSVVGEAGDAFAARDLIVKLRPDVMLLDVEMPKMDGITFLKRLMHYYPMPVVVCSSLTSHGGETAIEAYRAGAAEVICKPGVGYTRGQLDHDLIASVRSAAAARQAPANFEPRQVELQARNDVGVVAIGASTGGTVAIESIFRALPAGMPPLLVVQHMPAYITAPFAARLGQVARVEVREAVDGALLRDGLALLAPGGKQTTVVKNGRELRLRVQEGPRVNGHCPSVDVLFQSVTAAVGMNAIGVLLTGMGRDGAEGLGGMRAAGAHTIAQDEASSVVFGMPRAAIELGAAVEVAALAEVPQRIGAALQRSANERQSASMRRAREVR